jgi:formylglycine-generating enzyme required for sulfatase activity
VVKDCADTPDLMFIPAGKFRMGDVLGNGYDYERPVHPVQVEAFLIGRYEVTVAEWLACANSGACPGAGAAQDSAPNHPIALVSWDEAQQYVAWLSRHTSRSYRLPSEAEWEYAARAGSETQYTWGNNEASVCQHANVLDLSGRQANPAWTWSVGCDDGFARAAPVGSFPPNAWGLHDMIGNVWEWVADCWHGNYDGAPDNGSPWVEEGCPKRVNRGGGWGNHPRTTRVSTRDGDVHTARSDGLGFRVARNIIYAQPAPAGSAAGTSKQP